MYSALYEILRVELYLLGNLFHEHFVPIKLQFLFEAINQLNTVVGFESWKENFILLFFFHSSSMAYESSVLFWRFSIPIANNSWRFDSWVI